jgi:hypothetical protein
MIELTHDQAIADLILHGWGARKANRAGYTVYWLAKMETQESKGAWASGYKPIHTPMQQILLDILQGEIEPEVCEWDRIPKGLLRLLIDTEPMVLS